MSNILVSTITPCFRMKRYLKKFLEELPKQTIFEQTEIVLDHNDPDEEEIQWVKDFQAKHPGRIKHIITSPVVPIGTSMNTCIREASGEYLTIWNVDDLRTPDSLEIQVELLKKENADVAFGDYIIVRSFGATKGKTIYHTSIPESEFTRSMVFGPFLMFKKSICERAGLFDEQLVSGADFDFSIRLAFNGKAVATDKILGYYLNEGKGASTRPDSKQVLDRTIVELRYGIFDKINYDLVAEASTFALHHVMTDGVPHVLELYVPNYNALIKERIAAWKVKGLKSYTRNRMFRIYKIKFHVKNNLKRIYYWFKNRN